MNVFTEKVELSKFEYLNMLGHASELAEKAGSERMLIHYAKQYLELVHTMVTNGDDGLSLCHKDEIGHVRSAVSLLNKAAQLKSAKKY